MELHRRVVKLDWSGSSEPACQPMIFLEPRNNKWSHFHQNGSQSSTSMPAFCCRGMIALIRHLIMVLRNQFNRNVTFRLRIIRQLRPPPPNTTHSSQQWRKFKKSKKPEGASTWRDCPGTRLVALASLDRAVYLVIEARSKTREGLYLPQMVDLARSRSPWGTKMNDTSKNPLQDQHFLNLHSRARRKAHSSTKNNPQK